MRPRPVITYAKFRLEVMSAQKKKNPLDKYQNSNNDLT